jgi:amino acid permease
MFSILNEIKDNSPGSIVAVIGSSIGSAASIYVLVAITGYLTFGNSVNGNIMFMCRYLDDRIWIARGLTRRYRSSVRSLNNRQGCYRYPSDVQHPAAGPPLPSID